VKLQVLKIAYSLGPIVGGAFADSSATWRWAFYINLCIGGLFAPIYLLYLPSRDPRPGATLGSRCREIDSVGTILQIGAFISGIMAISFGGVLYNWNSATIIALFILSGVLFVLLGLQQSFSILTTLARRVFPVHYVLNKEMTILFAQIAAASTHSTSNSYNRTKPFGPGFAFCPTSSPLSSALCSTEPSWKSLSTTCLGSLSAVP